MRVLIWATALQADLLALAYELDRRADSSLLIVTPDARQFAGEPIARCRPIAAPILDRRAFGIRREVTRFNADVLVVDNHFPRFRAAPRVWMMWHGAGWKSRSEKDLFDVDAHVRRQTGAGIRERNERFRASCYGAPDRSWRVDRWRLYPDACRIVGMPFADLVRRPPYDRAALAADYRVDVEGKQTVLLNITWHYGRLMPGSWSGRGRTHLDDLAGVERLVAETAAREVNLLICLHDRHRYESKWLKGLDAVCAGHSHVEVKHRSDHPDNLADLTVADVMISNLSSFIVYFYPTGRPSIHLCPPQTTRGGLEYARLGAGGFVRRADWGAEPRWMRAPEDNGGLTVYTVDEACAALDRALADPLCCRERSERWLADHVAPSADAAGRLADELASLAAAPIRA